jgi:predicted DNA-binding protein
MTHSQDNPYQEETQTITVALPVRLAERIERHSRETGLPVTTILIEALDTFLRYADQED